MPDNFLEWLIIVLVALLFGKDTLLPVVLKKLGLGNGKNGNGHNGEYDKRLLDL